MQEMSRGDNFPKQWPRTGKTRRVRKKFANVQFSNVKYVINIDRLSLPNRFWTITVDTDMTNSEVTVNQIWSDLLKDPAQFLSTRVPLEDDHLECKASVFNDMTYDYLVEKHGFNGPTSLRLKFHDNLFNTIVAIAGMANKEGGGIVLIGVCSAPSDPLTPEELFQSIKLKHPDELKRKIPHLCKGVRLGNAQVLGLEEKIRPKKKETFDQCLDRFMTNITGAQSILFGGGDHNEQNLHDPTTWYCLDFVESKRVGYTSAPAAIPWGEVMWSSALTHHLIYDDAKFLTVTSGNCSASFVAIKIKPSPALVFLRVRKCFDSRGAYSLPESCVKKIRKREEKNWIPFRSHGRTDLEPATDKILAMLSEQWRTGGRVKSDIVEQWVDTRQEEKLELTQFFDVSQHDKIANLLQSHIMQKDVWTEVENFLAGGEPCLLITGPPGGGKSALLAKIITGCNNCPDYITAFHYIDHTRRNWRAIIASIMAQLAESTGVFLNTAELINIRDGAKEDSSIVESYQIYLAQINKALIKNHKTLCIFFDALDELHESESVSAQSFDFIPKDISFSAIKFILSSRSGQAKIHLCNRHMKNEPVHMFLPPLGTEDVEEFVQTFGMQLTEEECTQLLQVTGGNPLYIKALLKRKSQDPGCAFSTLPASVGRFYQMDLAKRLKSSTGELAKQVLALVLVAKCSLMFRDICHILGIHYKTFENTVLPLLDFYLVLSGEGYITRRVNFFHLVVAESLISGELPLIDIYDRAEAIEKVIAWCDCLETVHSSDEPYSYGINHLPAHCWDLGEMDGYERFQDLLRRSNLQVELACRAFLRSLITSRKQKDIIANRCLNQTLAKFYLQGDTTTRTTFYRFNNDINGYGYDQWQEYFWEMIFAQLEQNSPLYLECFISCSQAGKIKNQRLTIAENLLSQAEGRPVSKNEERRLLQIVGACLCLKDRSLNRYNPAVGISFLGDALGILQTLSPDDFLQKAHGQQTFANWLFLQTTAAHYSDTGYYFNQIGKNREGINHYFKANDLYQEAAKIDLGEYLKTRSQRGIALTKANIGATIYWNGEYRKSLELLLDSLSYRLQIGQTQSALVNLSNIALLLMSLQLPLLPPFFTQLCQHLHQSRNRQGQIKRYAVFFRIWMELGDMPKAQSTLEQLGEWYHENNSSASLFALNWRQLWHAILTDNKALVEQLAEKLNIFFHSVENTGSLLVKFRQEYFLYWRTISLAHLLLAKTEEASQVVDEKLSPWFAQDDFYLVNVESQFLQLKAMVKEQLGEMAKAEVLKQQAQSLLDKGRTQIADIHFSAKLIRHIQLLVEECDDQVLYRLFKQIEPVLRSDLSAVSDSPR